ncbi:Coenzyme F420 hydrogenase/dehydrogenase, beta subunit C-terminal domain [Planctomycetota bacterium]
MRNVTSIQNVVQVDLCISCGACVSVTPTGAMDMVYDENKGTYIPRIIDSQKVSGHDLEFAVCPGKGLPIKRIAQAWYRDAQHESYALGRYRYAMAVHTTHEQIIKQASSGGVTTAIAAHLLETGAVRGVTACRFVYGQPGPRTESFVAYTLDDLIKAQGSKYCPTTTNTLMQACRKAGGAFLFSGTPCQVAALRLAQQHDTEWVQVFPYTLANFCGGYRDFRHLDALIRYDQMDPEDVTSFRFRGGGQPGSMRAEAADGRAIAAPYPQYNHRSLIPKHKRCVYCIDATGELADFSCGDAWLDRLLATERPWSIVMARSSFAEETIRAMIAKGNLAVTEVSEDEICASQRLNLVSKKYRQRKRMRLSRLFGMAIPEWDVDLVDDGTYGGELKTLLGKTSLGLKWLGIKRWLKKETRD